jgi:hypothetical protein
MYEDALQCVFCLSHCPRSSCFPCSCDIWREQLEKARPGSTGLAVPVTLVLLIRLIIRSGFRLVRLVAAFSLIESAPACPLHQVSKLVCINSPPPGAAIAGPPGQHRRWLLPASSSRGIGSRRVQRRRRISAGQQRCRLRPVRRPPRRSSRVPVLRRLRISATSAGTGRRKEWRRFHGGDS